jgi:DNA-binding transcriptional regulator YiaG
MDPSQNEDSQKAALALANARQRLPSPRVCALIRQVAGLSRHQIAEAVGVSASAVALWESGARKPNVAHLERYVTLLDELRRVTGLQGPEA